MSAKDEQKRPDEADPSQPTLQKETVPSEWEPGMVILDTYEVKEELGRGGFGTVHKVHHKGWNVDLAVKSALGHVSEEDIVREAEVWMELGLHPNIVSCHFVRVLGGIPRIFVEYVDGGTLADWLCGKKETDEDGNERVIEQPRELTCAQRLGIAIEICRGIQHAHSFEWTDREGRKQVGIVHRDLKPQNILLTPDGVARVTDFGLVRFGATPAPRAPGTPVSATDATLVRSIRQEDGLVGTPAYAAPEQWRSRARVDRPADIYAFGVILYELLCRRRPFELPEKYRHAMGELKLSEYRRMHCETSPPEPTSLMPDIDSELSVLLLRCLAKEPHERPASFAEVNDQLKAVHERLEQQNYDELRPEPKAAELLADSLHNRAMSLVDLGRRDEAEQCWQKALAEQAHHPESTYGFGVAKWRRGDRTDDLLLQDMEATVAADPNSRTAHYLLALVQIERGNREDGSALLAKAQRLSAGKFIDERALEAIRSDEGWWCRHVPELGKDCSFKALSGNGEVALFNDPCHGFRLLNISTGRCIAAVPGTWKYDSLCLSYDGRLAAGVMEHGALDLWDLCLARRLRTLTVLPDPLHASLLGFSLDAKLLLSKTVMTVQLWNTTTRTCLQTFTGALACMTGNGRWLAILDAREDLLRVHDSRTGRCVRSVTVPSGRMSDSLALDANGRLAAIGRTDGTIGIWDIKEGEFVRALRGHTRYVHSLAVTGDGLRAMSGSADGTVRLWDIPLGICIRTFAGGMSSVHLSVDGRLAAIAGFRCEFWRLPSSDVARAAFSPPLCFPRSACRVADDEDLFQHNLALARSALQRGEYGEAHHCLLKVRSLPNCAKRAEARNLWDLVSKKSRRVGALGAHRKALVEENRQAVSPLALSANGKRMACCTHKDPVRVWDASTGCPVATFDDYVNGITSISLDADGRLALLARGLWNPLLDRGEDYSLELWDTNTGTRVRVFGRQPVPAWDAVLSADGRWALSVTGRDLPGASVRDHAVRLWDVTTGRCVRAMAGHTAGVLSVAISYDGQYAVSTSDDHTLRIWDLRTGQCLRSFGSDKEPAHCACLSADGRRVMSEQADDTLHLWDTRTAERLQVFKGHAGCVQGVCLSCDGQWAASAGDDGTVRLWETSSGACLLTLEGHTAPLYTTQDFRDLLCARPDGTPTVFEIDWEYEVPEATDWARGAQAYLASFLTLHTPYAGMLPQDREPSEEEVRLALTRRGRPHWNEVDFTRLIYTLGCAGYGWLRPEGVRGKLEEMAADWKGPPPLPGESPAACGGVVAPEAIRVETRKTPRKEEKRPSSADQTGTSAKPPAPGRRRPDLEKTLVKPDREDGRGSEDRQRGHAKQRPAVARNDPCPCGSGKKYKHCHGRTPTTHQAPANAPSAVDPALQREARMRVCSCGFRNPPENAFCNACGKALTPAEHPECRRCGKIVPPTAKFCVHCGQALHD